jgi:hypothetical protein
VHNKCIYGRSANLKIIKQVFYFIFAAIFKLWMIHWFLIYPKIVMSEQKITGFFYLNWVLWGY